MRKLLLFGASGAVGRFLMPLLAGQYATIGVSRSQHPGWVVGDLNDIDGVWPAAEIAISLGPLDAFAAWLERQSDAPRRVICFSSMSADSKRESPNAMERALAERLRCAETKVFAVGAARGIACTVFRPTLIYGAGSDRSLAPIARFARRWRVLPVPLGATGLRQPVHAADLANACAAAIDKPATYGRTYALGGGERLRFDAMLLRLRDAVPGFVLPIPVPRSALRIAARLARGRISAAAIGRLRDPLIADNSAAERDFGYAPVNFLAHDVLADDGAATA